MGTARGDICQTSNHCSQEWGHGSFKGQRSPCFYFSFFSSLFSFLIVGAVSVLSLVLQSSWAVFTGAFPKSATPGWQLGDNKTKANENIFFSSLFLSLPTFTCSFCFVSLSYLGPVALLEENLTILPIHRSSAAPKHLFANQNIHFRREGTSFTQGTLTGMF